MLIPFVPSQDKLELERRRHREEVDRLAARLQQEQAETDRMRVSASAHRRELNAAVEEALVVERSTQEAEAARVAEAHKVRERGCVVCGAWE